MSTKERSQEIRKQLKEKLGLNNKNVAVRMPHVGCIRVYSKNEATDKLLPEIERIAKGFEKLDRCEYTHEILAGGNDFVFIVPSCHFYG